VKVLLVSESYWPNADGGAVFEHRLVLGLISDGYELVVWAPGDYRHSYAEWDRFYKIYREKSLPLIINPKYRSSFWPWLSGRKIILREKPDIVHLHNAGFLGLTALFWAKRYGIPVVGTNHFMPENWVLNDPIPGQQRFTKWLIWKYLAWFHNRCDYVTSPTPTSVKLIRAAGLKAKAKPISNGVESELFKPKAASKQIIKKYGISPHLPIVLYLGRVDGEKRIDELIKAHKLLINNIPAQLVIAGFGKAEPALKTLVSRLGIEEYVHFTGFVDEADKPAIYNLAKVFAIASPAELQSIVLLEAMSSGLPVVAVDIAALSELCRTGKNGYLYKEGDIKDLAQKLAKILSSPQLQKSFGKRSREIILKDHQSRSSVSQYESVYNKVL